MKRRAVSQQIESAAVRCEHELREIVGADADEVDSVEDLGDGEHRRWRLHHRPDLWRSRVFPNATDFVEHRGRPAQIVAAEHHGKQDAHITVTGRLDDGLQLSAKQIGGLAERKAQPAQAKLRVGFEMRR